MGLPIGSQGPIPEFHQPISKQGGEAESLKPQREEEVQNPAPAARGNVESEPIEGGSSYMKLKEITGSDKSSKVFSAFVFGLNDTPLDAKHIEGFKLEGTKNLMKAFKNNIN